MKSFFVLIYEKQSQQASECYYNTNFKNLTGVKKHIYNNASLFYLPSPNPASNAEIFTNDAASFSFFGFGTFISSSYGILGADFQSICKKIHQSGSEFKEEFVNGIYAGITFSSNEIRVFNDFFGLSTLFYYQQSDDLFVITNSFEQLFRYIYRNGDFEWDESALAEYLTFGKTISGKTLIKNLCILLPAREVLITSEIKIQGYRSFSKDSSEKLPFNHLVNETDMLVKRATERLYKPQYTYCLSISGGIDSRIAFFNWPNRSSLMTETYGSNENSDTIKAKQLVTSYGNISLHEMEKDSPEKYETGLFEYLDKIDYPLMAGDNNIHHLNWKLSRNANIRFGGTDGELVGGENLYLSRKPFYVLKEGFFSYPYRQVDLLNKSLKFELLSNILYSSSKKNLTALLKTKQILDSESIVSLWENFIGECNSKEVYTERFRMYHTVVDHNYHFQNYFDSSSQITPYQDFTIIKFISATHPKLRELRRLQIAQLQKFSIGKEVSIDTTHLKISRPYRLHKFFRMVRFAINIGFSYDIPLLQKGTTLKTTIPAFYLPENEQLRKKIIAKIKTIRLLDNSKIERFLNQYSNLPSYNHFYATHEGWPNIFILLKLAIFEERIHKLIAEVNELPHT